MEADILLQKDCFAAKHLEFQQQFRLMEMPPMILPIGPSACRNDLKWSLEEAVLLLRKIEGKFKEMLTLSTYKSNPENREYLAIQNVFEWIQEKTIVNELNQER